MLQVDFVYASYISAPIGPTGALRLLMANEEFLASKGYNISVFTADREANGRPQIQTSAIKLKGSDYRAKLKWIIKRSRLLTTLFLIREQLRVKDFVRWYLSLKRQPNIVVFEDQQTAFYYLKLNKNSTTKTALFHHSDGKKWVMEIKSYPKLKGSLLLKWMDRWYEQTIHNVDRNVFIAKIGLENFAQDNPDIPRDSLSFFHNGIELLPYEPLKEGEPRYRLISTGTVDKRKGQHLIIEALGSLPVDKRADFHYTVLGSGPGLEAFSQLAAKLGVSEQIEFAGRIPNSEVPERLRSANVYILMSNSEGLPISIIEAMRAGLPVISTKVAGIPEQVTTGENGVLINPDAQELVEIFSNMEKYDWPQMGKRSRERFEAEFTFDQMLSGYIEMLRNLS